MLIYHGSPHKIDTFEPKPHYLTGGKSVVFGTPIIEIALASVAPWRDSDFEQGVIDEDPPYMLEQYPNAFEKIYGNASGYLYVLDSKPFYWQDNLTRFEYVSDTAPKILDVFFVPNALEALLDSEMQLVLYEDANAFRAHYFK